MWTAIWNFTPRLRAETHNDRNNAQRPATKPSSSNIRSQGAREYFMTWSFADRRIAESDRRCTSVCRNTDERTGFNPGDRIFILSRDDHLGSGRRFFVHGHHNHGQGVGTTRAGDVFFRAGGSRHIGSLFLLRSHPPPLNLSQRPITILITATA